MSPAWSWTWHQDSALQWGFSDLHRSSRQRDRCMSSPKWLQAPSSRVHAVELRDDDTDPNLPSSILTIMKWECHLRRIVTIPATIHFDRTQILGLEHDWVVGKEVETKWRIVSILIGIALGTVVGVRWGCVVWDHYKKYEQISISSVIARSLSVL